MMTGGTPVSSTKGVAIPRSQRGDLGQAEMAPRRLPMMKLRMVVNSSRKKVQGRAWLMMSVTVAG
ncbi:MAG: hypothetical protein K0Q69_4249 [Devosia sp.]|nr:hypothetical protein [Devosia sp.]